MKVIDWIIVALAITGASLCYWLLKDLRPAVHRAPHVVDVQQSGSTPGSLVVGTVAIKDDTDPQITRFSVTDVTLSGDGLVFLVRGLEHTAMGGHLRPDKPEAVEIELVTKDGRHWAPAGWKEVVK